MLKSFRRDCNAQSDNVNIVLHFDCNIGYKLLGRIACTECKDAAYCRSVSVCLCVSVCGGVWLRATETEIGAAVWAVWIGKIFCVHEYSCNAKLKDAESE